MNKYNPKVMNTKFVNITRYQDFFHEEWLVFTILMILQELERVNGNEIRSQIT